MKTEFLVLSRRRALLNGTAAVVAGATGVVSTSAWSRLPIVGDQSADLPDPAFFAHAVDLLAKSFVGPEPAYVLGRASLQTGQLPLQPGALFKSLFSRHPELADEVNLDDTDGLRHSLAHSVRRDFADGETIVAHRWLLARSEAEICSLICLS